MMIWNVLRIGLAAAFTLGGLDLLTATLFLSGTVWLVIAIGFAAPEVGSWFQRDRTRGREYPQTRW